MNYRNKRIELSETENEVLIEKDNIIENDGSVYYLKYLRNDIKGSKGGNSSVFVLYSKDTEIEERIIKISNYFRPHRKSPENIKRRYGRFINEIQVLTELKEKGKNNIIEIIFNGEVQINGRLFPY